MPARNHRETAGGRGAYQALQGKEAYGPQGWGAVIQ